MLAVNKFHNAISKNGFMLMYIIAHTIVKLTLNKVLLLLLLLKATAKVAQYPIKELALKFRFHRIRVRISLTYQGV